MSSGVKQLGGGGRILDEPFGPLWDGDTKSGASRNAIYDKIVTIGAGFGNTAFVRHSGDDATALVGNYLMPFKTIGAAIAALGTLPNSLLYIEAGIYYLFDFDTPYGLKAPGSKYHIYLDYGARVQYYGSYGLYCADGNEGTSGNIYGYGDLRVYGSLATKSVGGVSNYSFNVAMVPGQVYYEFLNLYNENNYSIYTGCMRIGASNAGNTNSTIVRVYNRMFSRVGITLCLDTDSNATIQAQLTHNVGIDQVGDFNFSTGYCLQITNPFIATFNNLTLSARGQAFGNLNSKCVSINNSVNGRIFFNNVRIVCISAPSSYRLIEITGAPAIMNNVEFNRCTLKNRDRSSFTSDGYSFYSDISTSFKIIDTYAEKNTGGIGVITNLISAGNGFQVDANL